MYNGPMITLMGKPFKTKEFLIEAAELVRMQLPPGLKDARVAGPVGSLIKLYYVDPKIHYEIWVRRREGTIELGLHFEGPAERNLRYLEELTAGYASTIASLGPDVEYGRWAGSWTRVHRTLPFPTLDEDALMVVCGCVSQMVRLLEPAVREISEKTE